MKRRFLLITMVVLLLCFIGYSFAEKTIEPASASDFSYVDNGIEVQINGYSGKEGIVRIPDTIGGLPVTRIDRNAFKDNESITGIFFPSTLTFIGEQAFGGCNGLGEISFPSGLTEIESSAFINCDNLSGVIVLPPKLHVLHADIFYNCDKVTGIVITSGCNVPQYAFRCMRGLKFLYITEGDTSSIGYYAVASECFEEAIIPKNVAIEDGAFHFTNLLTIYTPAGSDAEKYAKEHFIRVNTSDYKSKSAEYEKLYSNIVSDNLN